MGYAGQRQRQVKLAQPLWIVHDARQLTFSLICCMAASEHSEAISEPT